MFYKSSVILAMCGNVLGSDLAHKIERNDSSNFKEMSLNLEDSLNACKEDQKQIDIKADLGRIYFHLGNHARAKIYLEDVVKIQPDSLISHAYLGAIYDELSEHIKAQNTLEFCIGHYRKKAPDNMFDFAFSLMHLGKNLSQQGKYSESESVLRESIEKYQELSNEDYLIKAETLLAETYMYKGDYKKAEPYFKNVIMAYEKKSYPIIWTQLRLGRLYMFTGECEKAEPIFEEGVSILKGEKNVDYDKLGWNLFYLGDIYRSLSKFEEAERVMLEGLDAFKTCGYSAQHQITQWGNGYLGRLYNDCGQYEKAQPLLEESLRIHEEKYGQDSKRSVFIMLALANTYTNSQRYAEAESLFKRSLDIYEKQFGTNHTEYAQALKDYGYLAFSQNDIPVAEKRLSDALQVLSQEEHREAIKCREWLEKLKQSKE